MDERSIAVLLVEDNPGDARLFRETLAEVAFPNYLITEVGELDGALRHLKEAKFDLIVLDLGLPDEQGFATFARVREQAAQTPAIVLTGLEDEALGLKTVRQGAQDYLVKGQFDGNLLARAMRYAVERKQFEKELQRSEERWRTYVKEANDLIFTLDPAGRITSANQAVCATSGYREEELLGRSVLEVITPESYAAAAEALAKILNQEDVEQATLEAVTKNGGRLTLEVRGRMLYEGGQFAGTFHIARDVTRRKQAEDALRESENRYRQLFEAESDAVFLIENETGRILEANGAAVAMYGYSRQELLVMRNADLSAEPEDTRRVTLTSPMAADQIVSIPLRYHRRKDGAVFPVEITGRFFVWQGRPVHIAAIRDISQRKQAEEALRENESRLRAILDSLQTGVMILEAETHIIVDINPAGARLIGAPREAIVGMLCHKFVCPAEVGRCPITDLEQTADRAERVLLTADGTKRLIIKTVCRIMLGGRPHLVEGFTDITERKQAEEALRESEERHRVISSLTSDLAYAYRVEPDGNLVSLWTTGALERLTGFTAEELKAHGGWPALVFPEDMSIPENQLRALMAGQEKVVEYRVVTRGGDVRWMRDYARPEWDAEQGQAVAIYGALQDITERKQAEAWLQASLREKEVLLKEIHHRVKNNLQVVSSLLALQAKSAADPQVYQMFQDSRSRIQAMSLIHERLYRAKDLASIDAREYVCDLVAHLFSIYASPTRVVRSQVRVDDLALAIDTAIPCGLLLTELVSNVLKHAYPPEWEREGKIDVELRAAEGEWLTLTVSDDGVGLPADLDLKQAQSLGLQLVNLLARQIKGTVEVDRSAGTTFRITFPPVERQS